MKKGILKLLCGEFAGLLIASAFVFTSFAADLFDYGKTKDSDLKGVIGLDDRAVQFKHFGTMLDMSRNAVMNTAGVKQWIDITADLGYNTLMLYTEDTFEVDGNPYFGYMRGRYSKEELKEINAHALEKGMELIPCTQMLAHQGVCGRWPDYQDHYDAGDIFLVGDDRVYELIEDMFRTMAECFTSRLVHVGMDEAYMLGRGKYYDRHGDSDRSEILLGHLNRVAAIGKKYGFRLLMWSDTIFHLAASGDCDVYDAEIDASVTGKIPDNAALVYWDYYSHSKANYDRIISAHEKLKKDIWFAGGLWSWSGFAPHNGFSIGVTEAALSECRRHGVQDVFLTMWGDNGGECSRFSLLPSLFYASELAKGNSDADKIKEKFGEKYGLTFDQFMQLDMTGTPVACEDKIINMEKYALYNDCMTGLLDSTLTGEEDAQFRACAQRLEPLKNNAQWGWLFEPAWALCKVLSIKADLGLKTHAVYAGGDHKALILLIADYEALEKALEEFYYSYRRQWFRENKPHGFDVQDIRLGGLMRRVKSVKERLQALADGEISAIEELEEPQLDFRGNGKKFEKKPIDFNSWSRAVTTNVL